MANHPPRVSRGERHRHRDVAPGRRCATPSTARCGRGSPETMEALSTEGALRAAGAARRGRGLLGRRRYRRLRGGAGDARPRGTATRSARHRGMRCPRAALPRHPVVALTRGRASAGGAGIAHDARFPGGRRRDRRQVPTARAFLSASVVPLRRDRSHPRSWRGAVAAELLIEGRIFKLQFGRGVRYRAASPGGCRMARAAAEAMALARPSPRGARFRRGSTTGDRRSRGNLPLTEAEEVEVNGSAETEDFQNAFRAFLAKRKPHFVGR